MLSGGRGGVGGWVVGERGGRIGGGRREEEEECRERSCSSRELLMLI